MGTPSKDRPGGSSRCILGRDLAEHPDQNSAGARLPERQLAAARHARDDLLGAAASTPACDGRLPGGDAEIDAEAQCRVPRLEATAGQVARSALSSGYRYAE